MSCPPPEKETLCLVYKAQCVVFIIQRLVCVRCHVKHPISSVYVDASLWYSIFIKKCLTFSLYSVRCEELSLLCVQFAMSDNALRTYLKCLFTIIILNHTKSLRGPKARDDVKICFVGTPGESSPFCKFFQSSDASVSASWEISLGILVAFCYLGHLKIKCTFTWKVFCFQEKK